MLIIPVGIIARTISGSSSDIIGDDAPLMIGTGRFGVRSRREFYTSNAII